MRDIVITDPEPFKPAEYQEIEDGMEMPHLPEKDEIREWFSKVRKSMREELLRFALDMHEHQIRVLKGNLG